MLQLKKNKQQNNDIDVELYKVRAENTKLQAEKTNFLYVIQEIIKSVRKKKDSKI